MDNEQKNLYILKTATDLALINTMNGSGETNLKKLMTQVEMSIIEAEISPKGKNKNLNGR